MSTPPTNPSETFRRLNPHLYGHVPGAAVPLVVITETRVAKRRIRQDQKPLMNGLETKLFTVLAAGEWYGRRVSNLRGQAMRFRLANGLWYKPDITCLLDGRQAAFECKGPHSFRGGFENLKMAASQFPEIEWRLAWLDDGWQYQVVLP